MESNQAEAKWGRFTAKVKQEWGELTDDEVKKPEGKQEESIARNRKKYGESREAVAEKLNRRMD